MMTLNALRHGSRSVTCNYTNACLYLVSAFTRWRLSRLRLRISNCSLLLIYLPRKDERLSRPGWLWSLISCRSKRNDKRNDSVYLTCSKKLIQVERRTGKVRRSKTNVLPTVPCNQQAGASAVCRRISGSPAPTYTLCTDNFS